MNYEAKKMVFVPNLFACLIILKYSFCLRLLIFVSVDFAKNSRTSALYCASEGRDFRGTDRDALTHEIELKYF